MINTESLPDTQNQAWKNDKKAFGFRMLQKMGWSEGKGLGKNQDGMTEHLRVRKREETLGLGAKVDMTGAASLSSAVSDFNQILASLNTNTAAETQTKRARSDSNSSSNDSSDSDSASDSDSSEVSLETPKPTAPVRFIGRIAHHKVLRQKNVAAYSSQDLQAILGNAPSTADIVRDTSILSGSGASVALPDAPTLQTIGVTLSAKKLGEVEDKKKTKSKKDKKDKKDKEEKKREKEKKSKSKVKEARDKEEKSEKPVKEKKGRKEKKEKRKDKSSREADTNRKRKKRETKEESASKKRKKDKK